MGDGGGGAVTPGTVDVDTSRSPFQLSDVDGSAVDSACGLLIDGGAAAASAAVGAAASLLVGGGAVGGFLRDLRVDGIESSLEGALSRSLSERGEKARGW